MDIPNVPFRMEVKNPCLEVPFGLVKRTFWGGPYLDMPPDMIGIKVAAEIKSPCAMKVDIPDFSVPRRVEPVNEAILFALKRAANGLPVYVGCKGGQGRTGLFLALLVKAMGVAEPVEYVRSRFNSHAVETPEQAAYVENFDLEPLKDAIKKVKRVAFWKDFWAFFGIDKYYD